MTAIAGISLDAAGTLFRVRRPVGESYAAIAAHHGIDVHADTIGTAFRTVFPRMAPLAFGSRDPAALERQERDWWRTLVRGCLGPLGQHRAFNAFFDELYGYYAGAGAWEVYPEVPAVLDALDTAGLPAVVLSNFDSRLHRVLDELGLAPRFRAVLCSSAAGAAKPDRRFFALACDALGTPPARTLHAGDSRSADRDGARGAGLRGVWVNRARAAPADRPAQPGEVADLSGLLALLPG